MRKQLAVPLAMALMILVVALSWSYLTGPTSAQVGVLDSDAEVQAPYRKGEKPVIPLDTKDPTFNAWKKLRDFSKDPKRKPGPIGSARAWICGRRGP